MYMLWTSWEFLLAEFLGFVGCREKDNVAIYGNEDTTACLEVSHGFPAKIRKEGLLEKCIKQIL